MKKLAILFIMIQWLFLCNLTAQVPFECSTDVYGVLDNPARIIRADLSALPLDIETIVNPVMVDITDDGEDNPEPVQVNNMGFRVTGDGTGGFLYALAINLSGDSAATYGLIKIDADGVVYPVAIPLVGLPANRRFYAGDVTPDGSTMYITYGSHNTLYILDLDAIDLDPLTSVTSVAKDTSAFVADWAVSPFDGLLYGGSNDGEIWSLDPDTGAMVLVSDTLGLLTGAYGGAWFSPEGRFFLYNNSGVVYGVDGLADGPIELAFTQSEGIDGSSYNDGAACSARAPLLEVLKKVSVDGGTNFVDADEMPYPLVDAEGQVYFKFVITNIGTVTLTNVTLNDADYGIVDMVIDDLAPNESFTYTTAAFDAMAGEQTNTLTVTADDTNIGTGEESPDPDDLEYDGPDATESDSATYFGVVASVDVEKEVSINGSEWMDADSAPGPAALAGSEDTVTFRITVTNTGNAPLVITFVDLFDGVEIPLGDPDEVDGNVWTIGPFDAGDFGLHVNTVTATGTHTETGAEGSDTDSAYYTAYYWAFTPGFWKNHAGTESHNARKGRKGSASRDAWFLTAYSTDEKVSVLIDCDEVDEELTLIEALSLKGGGGVKGAMSNLLRTGIATLLNASFHEEGYGGTIPENFPYTTEEVLTALEDALCSGDVDVMNDLQEHFTEINEGLHIIDWSLLDD